MASVFEATHEKLDKTVALKIMHPHLAAVPRAVARFLREGQAAARIRHPHTVTVFDAGTTADGTPYLAMELERGETLRSWLRTFGPLGPAQTVDLLLPVLSAIQHAHSLGIIHRDVPEQSRAPREAGEAADEYSCGVMLYECLTGRLPFEAESAADLSRLIQHAPVIPPRSTQPKVPAALEAVVLRTMEKELYRRFSSIADLARALLPFASEHAFLVYSRDFSPAVPAGGPRSSTPKGETQDEWVSTEEGVPGTGKRISAADERRPRLWMYASMAAGVVFAAIAALSRGNSTRTELPVEPSRRTDLAGAATAPVVGVPLGQLVEVMSIPTDLDRRPDEHDRDRSKKSRPVRPTSRPAIAASAARPPASASPPVGARDGEDDLADPRLDRR